MLHINRGIYVVKSCAVHKFVNQKLVCTSNIYMEGCLQFHFHVVEKKKFLIEKLHDRFHESF